MGWLDRLRTRYVGAPPWVRQAAGRVLGLLPVEARYGSAYRQTIARLEIGLGSAVSVLLFLSVVLIAFGFIKGFKVDLAQARGEK